MVAQGRGAANPQELRRDFWQSFKDYMQESSSVRCARVTTDGWMWHRTDLSTGNLLSMIRIRLGEIGVKYTLNDMDAETVFSFLLAHRETVDAAFERALTWRPGGADSQVIEIRRPADLTARQTWAEHFSWLRRQLETFHLALWSLVGRLPPRGERRQWEAGSFMREAQRWNPASVQPAKAILEWSLAHRAAATWGRGGRCGSFTPTIPHCGFPYQLVSVRTDGTFASLFTQLKNSPLFWGEAQRRDVVRRLNCVGPLALPEAVVSLRPSLPLAVLADGPALAQFLEVLDWFEDVVRSS